MEIKQVKISELKPAEYNPRLMTEKQALDLETSIKRFGFVDPIIVNIDNTIIGGHQRCKIAKKLGMTEVPVFYLDLDKEKEKELNLRLNKNNGEWDWDLLASFDKELLEDVGFNKEDIDFNLDLDDEENEAGLGEDKEKDNECPECGYKWYD